MRIQTYSHRELGQLEVKLTIKRVIDENKMLSELNDPDIQYELMFSCQLIVNGRVALPIRRTRFIKKLLYDETIIFNYRYRDLPYSAIAAVDIWSTGKAFDRERPLASTTFSLFDENFKLRTGKYHLMLWPDRRSDTSSNSTTPGIVSDKNIRELNYITEKVELYERNTKNIKIDNRSEESLKLKLLYTYKMIPGAFLQIQLPSFNFPVYYDEPEYNTIEFQGQKSKTEDNFDENLIFYDPDYDKKLSDPLEEQFFNFIRDAEGNPEDILPTREEMQEIQKISKKPQCKELKPNEKLPFYKYRYALSKDKRFLIHFLHSVQWTVERLEQEALVLLRKWAKIDRDDALHLLTSAFCANKLYNKQAQMPSNAMKAIRQYAVNIISESSNKELSEMMLQLVQALRYDGDGSALAAMLTQRANKDIEIATLYFWYLKAETEPSQNGKEAQSELATTIRQMYTQHLQEFQNNLQCNSQEVMDIILEQQRLVEILRDISKEVKAMGKDMPKKKEELRRRITEVDWSIFEKLRFPLNTLQTILEPIRADCTIFSSAMAPFKLAFNGLIGSDPKKIEFIYKSGDDLRQDQLILQMFSLMDSLLRGVNQDYKLIPYKALACSKIDGFVEFVPQTKTLQDILDSQSISQFLQKLATNPECPVYSYLFKRSGQIPPITEKFISENQQACASIIMDNYILSCAGYCAITYFFGIGDRHLENLLINDCGQIFHIDFGFILGRDPKPYPPPIKLSKEMAQAMGGKDSDNFLKFKFKCTQAYLYLRRYSKLITNLFELMMDSGIKDLNYDTMNGLYEKFCLGINDKEAEKHFLLILQESLSAVFAGINDKIHRWATYWRR